MASAEIFVGRANNFLLLELGTMTNEGVGSTRVCAKGPELENVN